MRSDRARFREPVPAGRVLRMLACFIALVLLYLLTACERPAPAATAVPIVSASPSAAPAVDVDPGAAPTRARKYQRTLIREARATWGLGAPVPLFGAQVEQESGWNVDARSPVGAQGLGQFMPSTADWLGRTDAELGPAQPTNPEWSIRALVRYDKLLYDHATTAIDECNRHAFALVGYNGGEGWRIKDQRAALAAGRDARIYWGQVEQVNAGRSAAAWNENRGYPKRIIRTLQPRYATWGQLICQ